MHLSQETYMRIFDNLYHGLFLVDRRRKIIYWNKAAERISGYKASEVLGKYCSDDILAHIDEAGNNLCKGHCTLAKAIDDGDIHEAEVFLHHKEGHRLPISVRTCCLKDPGGNIIGGVEMFSDLSRYKSIESRVKELEELALLDSLTRTANRNYVEKEINIRFKEYKRFGDPFGILFIDIDNLGHQERLWYKF